MLHVFLPLIFLWPLWLNCVHSCMIWKIPLQTLDDKVVIEFFTDDLTSRAKKDMAPYGQFRGKWVNKCLRSIPHIWWPKEIWNEKFWRQATADRGGSKRSTLKRPEGPVPKTALERNQKGNNEKENPMELVRTWEGRTDTMHICVVGGKSHWSK